MTEATLTAFLRRPLTRGEPSCAHPPIAPELCHDGTVSRRNDGGGLFSTPWLELWLGRARFGACRVIADCHGYLTLLELGLGGALAHAPGANAGSGGRAGLTTDDCNGRTAYLCVTLLTLATGLAATPLIPRLASQLSPITVADLRRAWIVGLIGFLPQALVPFRRSSRHGSADIGSTAAGGAVAPDHCNLARARVVGLGDYWAGAGGCGGDLGLLACLTVSMARANPGLFGAVWAMPNDRETWRSLSVLSVPTLMINLGGRISLLTDNLVIGALLGAAQVTTLFFTQRLAVLAQSLLQGVGCAVWASLADLHARAVCPLQQAPGRAVGLVAILSVAGLGPIVAYNRQFVGLWMGSDFAYGGDLVVVAAAVNAFMLAQLTLWSWCFGATGQVQRVVRVSVASSSVNLAASLVLTRRFGLVGPLLGTTFASVAVGSWALPWLLRGTFGVSVVSLVRATLPPLVWGLLYSAGLWWAARRYPPSGWVSLVVEMGLAVGGFLFVGGAIVLAGPEGRSLWRLRLRVLRAGRLTSALPRRPLPLDEPRPDQTLPINAIDRFRSGRLRRDALAHVPDERRGCGRAASVAMLLSIVLRSSGFHVMISYRMAHALAYRAGPLGRALAGVLFWWNRHFYACSIASTARLHGGVILPHPQGIVIGPGVVVGPRAWIFQNVTIGGVPGKLGMPAIGADARIFCGAVVTGPVTLGDNVMIGANAVVHRDVPARTLVRCVGRVHSAAGTISDRVRGDQCAEGVTWIER